MELRLYKNVAEYRDQVWPFLLQREAQNCLAIGVVGSLAAQPTTPPPYLWAAFDQQQVCGAAWMTPPHPLGLTPMPNHAAKLIAEAAAKLSLSLPGVTGPKEVSDAFKDLWLAGQQKVSLASSTEQRIYQLTEVHHPPVPSLGSMRLVGPHDLPLIEEWSQRFLVDCGLTSEHERRKGLAIARESIAAQNRYLWMVDGLPVAMAAVSGATPSGIRINWVYTPESQRSKGYASALVATLCDAMLVEGHMLCFLYTDLANPVSNHIYQKIGFRPVADAAYHVFK